MWIAENLHNKRELQKTAPQKKNDCSRKSEAAVVLLGYDLPAMKKELRNITPFQLKMPVEMDRVIEAADPEYTFNKVMERIDLRKCFAVKERRTGRPGYARLKEILFVFMKQGYIKRNRAYTRAMHRGLAGVLLETALIPAVLTSTNTL